MYALIKNGQISRYPYTLVHLHEDHPETSFPDWYSLSVEMREQRLLEYGVCRVYGTQQPVFDKLTHSLREMPPIEIDGRWTQQWEVYSLPAEEVEANQAAAVQAAREKAKADRQAVVDAIKVTTQAGNTFDGDEISQTRMVRAIIALQATGTPSVTWVLADNTAIQATAAELSEALALSGAAQAAIWAL